MAGFMDILGTVIQQGMSQTGGSRMTKGLGAGAGNASLNDLMGSLTHMLGGGKAGAGNLGGVLGDVIGSLSNNKAALGGLAALAGALLGGGKSSARGAVGGGGLAMLASLAMAALRKSGQASSQTPRAFMEAETPEAKQALDEDAEIIVKAMINAAKADGRIDEKEIQKIIGKLEKGGLTEEEKAFFVSEAEKPMDLDKVIRSSRGKIDKAAEIYAASLLAIKVDTPAEQEYMKQLASGLKLHPEVASYIEQTLGV